MAWVNDKELIGVSEVTLLAEIFVNVNKYKYFIKNW